MNEGQLWLTIGADNTQFQKTARDTNRKLSEMSQNVKAFSQGITSSFTEAAKSMAGFYAVAKAGTMFQDLIEKNDQFNKSMREVSTLSDEVANNLDAYKQKILELTTQIPIGADEAAKALYQINSAGHAGADGMAVLEASAKAAIGGVTDTATAADTITTVLNAYKMSSSEAAAVSDKLFTAVKLGKTTMGELGASIAQVAPVAASFGVSIDQVLGAIATLTKNGTPTAQAVTQIRAAIVSLSSALGSTYFETHTLQQGMNEIRQAIPDNNKLKESLGTIEAVNAVLAMTGKNASGAAADLKELSSSAGAAAKAYAKMSGGKGNELTKLQNNVMKELAGLNDTISDVVTNVAKKINEAFDSGTIEEYIDVIKELVVAYGAYKAIAITVAAVQSANAMITQTAETAIYEAQVAELRKVIALKEAEVDVNGNVVVSKTAETTARGKEIAALKEEAAEVAKVLKEKAAEAAQNLANAKSEQAMAQAQLSSAQTGVAMRQQELEDIKKSGDALKEETAEIELQKAALEEDAAKRRLVNANREVEIAQSKANATAKVAETAATGADTAATAGNAAATGFLTKAKIALTVAMNKLKAAMLSNPYTLMAVAVAALAYGIYKLVQHIQTAAEEQKKYNQQIYNTVHAGEALKKSLKSIADGAAKKQSDTIAELRSQYQTLQTQWKSLGGDLEKQKKFIIDNSSAFHTLGFEVTSVDDAEKLLVKNTQAVVAAMEARAKAAAAQELMTESYKKKIQAEQKVMSSTSGYRSAHQKGDTIKWNQLNDDEREYLKEQFAGRSAKMYKQTKNTGYADQNRNISEEAAQMLDKYNRDKLLARREAGLKSIQDETDKQIKAYEKDLTNAVNEAEEKMKAAEVKAYEGTGGSGSSSGGTNKNKAYWEQQRDAVQKQIDDLDSDAADFKDRKAKLEAEKRKYVAEIAKYDDPSKGQSARDKKKEELEKQIETRKQLNQELLEIQAKNNDDWIALMEDGHDKRMREIANEYTKEQNEISKTALKWAKENKNAGLDKEKTKGSVQVAGITYDGLTDEQKDVLEKAIANAQQKMEKGQEMLHQEEEQMLNNYLKEYGTYQEKRAAIAADYDKKIAKMRASGASDIAIKTAQKEEDRALADIDFEKIKKDINWEYVFGDLNNVNTETLKVVNDQLKDFMAAANNLTPDQIQTVTEAMARLQDKMDMSDPINSIKIARREFLFAKQEFDKYAKDYENAKAAGDKAGMDKASKGMTKADQKMTKAKNKEAKAFNEVTGTVNNYAEALKAAGDAIGGATGDCLKLAASAIQAGVGMANGIKAFGNAVSAMEKSVAILAIIEAALQAVQMIANLFGDTADQTLTNYVAAMDTYLNLLKDDINAMNDAMKSNQNTIKETTKYYQELIELEKKQAMGIKSQSQTWLNSGASKGFLGIGSSSSEGVKITKNIESQLKSSNKEVQAFYQKGYDQLNEYFRKVNGRYADSASGFGRMDFIWKLSDDDLRQLAKDTEAMSLLGDELSGAVKKYVDAIGEATDALDAKLEAILGVSFEDFYDDFTDMIKNMDNSSADFAKNFGQYLNDALVKNMVAEKYKGKLEQLWKWAGMAMEGGYLEENMEYYRNEYQKISEEAQREAEMIAKITGVTEQTNQEAMANAIESITADQADQLIGRITAIQIAVEADRNTKEGTLTQLTMLSSLTTQGNAYLSDILSQHAIGNSYLEDIARYSKSMSLELVGFEERMRKLTTNSERF